jgi:hypothetical protein
MNFLRDFAGGFMQTGAAIMIDRKQEQAKQDALRAKELRDLDAQKTLLDYKADIERRAAEEATRQDMELLKNSRLGSQMQSLLPATESTAGAVDVPTGKPLFAMDDAIDTQAGLLEDAALFQMMGKDKLAKAAKTQADTIQLRRDTQKQARTEAREGVKTLDNLNVAEELTKEDAALLKESTTKLSSVYLGTEDRFIPEDRSVESVKLGNLLAKQSAKATAIAAKMQELTADPATGISNKSSGEIKVDARELVKLGYQYNISTSPEEKDRIISEIKLINDIYGFDPEQLGDVLNLSLDNPSVEDNTTSEEVTLTPPPTSEAPAPAPTVNKIGQTPVINSKQEYDALPKGTLFIDPQGNERIKP